MTEDEICTNLIAQSMDSGWQPRPDIGKTVDWKVIEGKFLIKVPIWDFGSDNLQDQINVCSIESVLFDHKFAKSLWGEENWQKNITELAISANRAEYLKTFIKNDVGLDTK